MNYGDKHEITKDILLLFDWISLFERQDGSHFVRTKVSINETKNTMLARLNDASYGKDAMLYQCIIKGFLSIEEEFDDACNQIFWLHEELY
ncbi:hypothetical protein GC093_16960 [Paenibacillus sp. LMG 31456]|uniref:Uncharacterized protein n=1 Tax=Paenibacillus foliorum TaxID=2654974 RepID=A0A972JZS6_9BACL|nr:hypothetical protein [Paenibacillus foliorum]NOU94899.1 hypothetical protein [Paenibacillus foliorum]